MINASTHTTCVLIRAFVSVSTRSSNVTSLYIVANICLTKIPKIAKELSFPIASFYARSVTLRKTLLPKTDIILVVSLFIVTADC